MAGLISGGKRAIYFTESDGSKDIKSDSDWNAGKAGSHRRSGKDHKSRTGKTALRKAKHHYGSSASG